MKIVSSQDVRCPVCDKKLGENLVGGILTIWCRRCKAMVIIDRTQAFVVKV